MYKYYLILTTYLTTHPPIVEHQSGWTVSLYNSIKVSNWIPIDVNHFKHPSLVMYMYIQ